MWFDAIIPSTLGLLRAMIAAHRWHLACEFSNWIETINHNH